mmetsp:Transcript_20720/g.65039  ORF Transcript_20720/g.65039 Transcript_20720/m.65039 type:complete len:243 (-) Transcript_20720:439-1167(-)
MRLEVVVHLVLVAVRTDEGLRCAALSGCERRVLVHLPHPLQHQAHHAAARGLALLRWRQPRRHLSGQVGVVHLHDISRGLRQGLEPVAAQLPEEAPHERLHEGLVPTSGLAACCVEDLGNVPRLPPLAAGELAADRAVGGGPSAPQLGETVDEHHQLRQFVCPEVLGRNPGLQQLQQAPLARREPGAGVRHVGHVLRAHELDAALQVRPQSAHEAWVPQVALRKCVHGDAHMVHLQALALGL